MGRRRWISSIAAGLLFAACVAAAAVPGPQRALAPGLFGLTEIADGVWTDDPGQGETQMRMIAGANARVRAFFGDLGRSPRLILCVTMMCEKTFGGTGNVAVAYGWHAVRIPPKAFREPDLGIVLLAHERTHIELHRSWGWRPSALWDPPQPNWFDEGLASFVSRDHRLPRHVDGEAKAWIRGSLNFRDWGGFIRARGWRNAYGAAAANVADLRERLGDAGLRELIARTNAGEPFSGLSGLPDGG
ncbi:MAG: hypothetical protein WAT70_12375 [Rhizobiaceae bacterium]